jgi:hypothetical protein
MLSTAYGPMRAGAAVPKGGNAAEDAVLSALC